MANFVPETQTVCYAWALISNHAHFLLRSGSGGIAGLMRRLLTGHAVYFNRRHRRHGHLLQNRYKSIICQEDIDFKELVRYIHLNPLRANWVVEQMGISHKVLARRLLMSQPAVVCAVNRGKRIAKAHND